MTREEQQLAEKIITPMVITIVTAIITTLIVEYFAKPKLEARKARLIRDREQLDQIIFDFQHISASLGAISEYKTIKSNTILRHHYEIMLEEARNGLYKLMKDLSRLSSRFVVNHDEHVKKTNRYIGYLLSQIELIQEFERKWKKINKDDLKKLKNDAQQMELFDIYFLVYPYLIDSQEDWWRRWYWRLSKKRPNNEAIDSYFKSVGIAK